MLNTCIAPIDLVQEDKNMTKYEEGMKLIEECCGYGKDNVISLSTIARDLTNEGNTYPVVRDVDAYYEDGIFYITTDAQSNKMGQIAANNEVAFSVCLEGISGIGIAHSLGWVKDPKNAAIRLKLREVFSDWYDKANHEEDENCIILAVHITKVSIFRGRGTKFIKLDLMNQKTLN